MAKHSQFFIREVEQAIITLLRQNRKDNLNGWTISEIYESLHADGLQMSQADVDKLIQGMDAVEEQRHPNRSGAKLYCLAISQWFRPREEIERETLSEWDLWTQDETERAKVTKSVLEDIALEHVRTDDRACQLKEIAPRLAKESPIELILEVAKWVVEDLNKLATDIRVAKTGKTSDVSKLSRELGFRRTKAVRFFQQLFRLDGPSRSSPGILHLPIVEKMEHGELAKLVNVAKARERLKERCIGSCVVETVYVSPQKLPRSAVGTDASVGDIQVPHQRGSFIPPTPAVLFVSAGAMEVQDGLFYRDFDTYPREADRYDDLEAAVKGLLISPKLHREAITDFKHLRSAAMALRQYEHELRIVQRQSSWSPMGGVPELKLPPPITLLIRDGRLFPLVHRLTDYDGASAPDDVLYGEVVRGEITAFDNVFQQTVARGKIGATYSAAVKSPEFSWLAMLAFWYLQKQQNKQDGDWFYRPPLNDQAVTHLLFWGLAESNKEIVSDDHKVMRTCCAVRHFCDIAFPSHPLIIPTPEQEGVKKIVDESEQEDWLAYIQHHIQDANRRYDEHKRGVPALGSLDEYNSFINLCYRAGVAMFHSAPTRMYRPLIEEQSPLHFLLPRWEVAVDVTDRHFVKTLEGNLEKMLAWINAEGGLTIDDQHGDREHEEERGLPLWVPNVVMEAHKAATFVRDVHTTGVTDRIHKLIQDIQEGKLSPE